jgi:glycosyltransferase involved in cell wall biosynthesis
LTTAAPLAERPLVSVGLPVYNGGNYLRTAVDSILRQTYKELELVICDNASTDDTAAICGEAAALDSRVRVYRQDRNVGAAANYNRAFELARGRYFKWAAHDDVLAPTFIERAVEVLESDPGVVLCSSRTGKIDHRGELVGTYASDASWDSAAPSDRFRGLLFSQHACVAVFGLIRRSALAATPLIAPYVNSDRVLLAELGLHGRIHEVPEALFFRRDHPGSSVRSFDHRRRVAWFDPARSARFAFPEWNLVLGYMCAVRRAPVSRLVRGKCLMTVAALSMHLWRPLLADFKYALVGVPGERSTTGAVVP